MCLNIESLFSLTLVDIHLVWYCCLVLCCGIVLLQMSRRSSRGKNIAADEPATPVAKRTRLSSQASQDPNEERFRLPLNSHVYSNVFDKSTTIVERVVEFNTLGTTFIPRIFENRDWANLFGNFDDPMDELVKECFSNATDLGVQLIFWVRGTEFSVSPDSIADLLSITRPQNVNLTPYDERTPEVGEILQILGSDHEVSSAGTSISTAKFAPELTTLKLIMFTNLYPLSNTTFINLGRALFLCDLITGAPIDICAHIYYILRKTACRSAARGVIPFCSLIMKLILREGITPPADGKMLSRQRPISLLTLQASRSHSSKSPRSAHLSPVTPSAPDSETPAHTTSSSRAVPEASPAPIPQAPTAPHTDRAGSVLEHIQKRVDELVALLYSTNNHVQMRLETMENQLDDIQRKLDESL